MLQTACFNIHQAVPLYSAGRWIGISSLIAECLRCAHRWGAAVGGPGFIATHDSGASLTCPSCAVHGTMTMVGLRLLSEGLGATPGPASDHRAGE